MPIVTGPGDMQGVQVPDTVGNFARIVQLRNQMQNAPLQRQLLQQQVQSGQQDIATRQALNSAYAGAVSKDAAGNPTIDANKLAQGLSTGPAAYKTPEVMEGITKFHKTLLDTQTAATDLQAKQTDLLGSAASAVRAANYDPTLAHSLLDSLPQSPQLNAIRSQIDNPQALKRIVDSAIAASPKQRELAASEQTAGARTMTAENAKAEFNAKMNPQSPLYAPSQASVALGTAPGAAQIQAGEAQLAGKKSASEVAARQPFEMQLARQRQALSQGDPAVAAQLLVNRDATLSELKSRGATPDFIARTLFEAKRISGGKYNAPEEDANFKVAQSPANVAFFGSAKSLTEKGGTLDQLADAAKSIPQNQFPVFNSLEDWAKEASGSGPMAHYASLVLGVADDYSKVMGGGQGSDTSRLQAANLVSKKLSAEGRAGAISGIRGAVGSQITGRIGKNPVMQRMYGDSEQASVPTSAPSPQTHTFSLSAWQKANPQGDPNAARTAAAQQGYQVVQ